MMVLPVKRVTIDAASQISQLTLQIRMRGMRRARFRLRCAQLLLKLAGWVGGYATDIEVAIEPRSGRD